MTIVESSETPAKPAAKRPSKAIRIRVPPST